MVPMDALRIGRSSVDSTQIESTYLYRAVKWFRAEGQNEETQSVRKIAAVALAFFLCLTGIGIIVVIHAVREWNRQAMQINKPKVDEVEPEEDEESEEQPPAPPVVSSSMTVETVEIKKEAPPPPPVVSSSMTIETVVIKTKAPPPPPIVSSSMTIETVEVKTKAPPPPPIVSSSMTIETVEVKKEKPKVKPKPVEDEDEYPLPLETLSYSAQEQKTIITKVNKALKGTLPGVYVTLKEKIPKEKLEKLLDEAKILAHYWAVKDSEGRIPPADIYRTLIVTNLDMLLRGLAKDKMFPNLDN